MKLHTATVIKAATTAQRWQPDARAVAPRRVSHFELAARETAEQLLAQAREEAAGIVAAAHQRAQAELQQAQAELQAAEEARFAAHYTALQLERDQRLAQETERLAGLAVVLAERVVGESLRVAPELIERLAHTAIAEARGAQSLAIDAHPDDVDALQRSLAGAGAGNTSPAITVRPRADLERGSLMLHTQLGTLDARLRPQLERLAGHLASILRGA